MAGSNLTKKVILPSLLVLMTVFAAGCGLNLGSNQTTEEQNQQSNYNRPQDRGGFQQTPEEIADVLKPLVDDGTLSQEKVDAVKDYLLQQAETRRKQMQDRQNRNGQNPPNGFSQNPNGQQNPGWGGSPNGQPGGFQKGRGGQRPNMLGELVSKGTLTQTQADKIMDAMFQARGMNNR